MSNPKSNTENLKKKIQLIKALVLDVDGVMTNGSIIQDHEGRESKVFNAHDGLGLYLARVNGLIIGLITGRKTTVVEKRAKELKVKYLAMGAIDKIPHYEEFKEKFDLKDEEIAYVGDDILDIPVMLKCGLPISPENGRDEVKAVAEYTTQASGGNGAVREVIELIFKNQEKWDKVIGEFYGK